MFVLGEIDKPDMQAPAADSDGTTSHIDSRRVILAFLVCLGVFTTLFVAGLSGRLFEAHLSENWSEALGLVFIVGAVGLCASALFGEYCFLVYDWAQNNRSVLYHAFWMRDRRGTRVPLEPMCECLQSTDHLEEALREQSDSFLLTLDASGRLNAPQSLIESCLTATSPPTQPSSSPARRTVRSAPMTRVAAVRPLRSDLAAHPAIALLTLVDLACSSDRACREQAVRILPVDLWLRATLKLLRARYPEARIAGIRCRVAPARILWRLCGGDSDESVRRAAWERLRAEVSEPQAVRLLDSRHVDVRLRAVESGKLSRRRLMRVCEEDSAEAVRSAAWRGIGQRLEAREASALAHSRYVQTRIWAAESGTLSRSRCVALCAGDREQEVRQAAGQALRQGLTKAEALTLRQSGYADVRRISIKSGLLSHACLLDLCLVDGEQELRLAAWSRLDRITLREYRALSHCRYLDVRLAVADHPNTPREILVRLSMDKDHQIRASALRGALIGITDSERKRFARSRYPDVRLAVANEPGTPERLLRRLRRDRDDTVRTAVWHRLLRFATPAELEHLAGSEDAVIRAVVAVDRAASKSILLRLTTDPEQTIRTAALQRLLPDLTADECSDLSKSSYQDVRQAIGDHPNTSREVLRTLATDADAPVRQRALPHILPDASWNELAHLLQSSSPANRPARIDRRAPALSSLADVQQAAVQQVRANLGQRGAEVVLPHLADRTLQTEVVEAVLSLEGSAAVARILSVLDVNTALRLVSSPRLVEFFRGLNASEIAAILSRMTQEAHSLHVGRVTVVHEQTSYDSYSGPSTYTSTTTENRHLTVSYFDPVLVEKAIQALSALKPDQGGTVTAEMVGRSRLLAELLSAGLAGRDWRNLLHQPILRSVRDIKDSNFRPLPDADIIRQIDGHRT